MVKTTTTDSRTVRPSDVMTEVLACIKAKRPVMLWGPPGIGKSEIIEQIGKNTNRGVIDLRLLLLEPTDLRGIPYFNSKENKMDWAPPVDLPSDPKDTSILFLDEINAADKPSVMVFNKVDAFTYEKKDEDDLTPATKSNISLEEWKRTWMAKSRDSIFISALQKDNFDSFKHKLYEMAKEIHAKRFPYNSFLY